MFKPDVHLEPPRTPLITPLARRVTTPLRSSLVIPTLPQLLSELIQNSLDAGACGIECFLDLTRGREGVRVEDDGSGINKEELKRIGRRYATNKAANAPGTGSAGSYGYRGEALSSIASLGMLEITSRTEASRTTCTKLIRDSKLLYEGTSSSRTIPGSHGTIVSVKDLFHNVPVRQSAITSTSPQTNLSACKRVIVTLALARTGISWSLWDESQDGQGMKRLLYIPPVITSIEAFRHVYGNASVENIRVSSGRRRIDGFISLEGLVSKSHQHLYVNHYPLERGELHQAIAKRFASSRFSSMTSDSATELETAFHQRRSPRRLERYPVYVMNVSLPFDEVDVGYEPKKGILGHKDFDAVKAFVLAVVDQFLKRHGFAHPALNKQDTVVSPSKSPRKRMVLGERISPSPSRSLSPLQPISETPSKSARSNITTNDRKASLLATPVGERLLQSEPPRKKARLTPKPGERQMAPAGGWLQELLTEMESDGALPISLRSSPRTQCGTPSEHIRHNGLIAPSEHPETFNSTNPCCSHTPQAIAHHIPLPVTSEIAFTKDALRNVKVLNQVDRKFIPCVLESNRGRTLVLLDQHAADERVSVESILKSLCEGFWRDDVEHTILTRTQPRVVLSREEGTILDRPGSVEVFRRWGIHLEVRGGVGDYRQVEVKAVPTVLLSRLGRQEASEMTRLIKLFLPVLERSPGELNIMLQGLSGEEVKWPRIMRWMPREMLELTNSKACRGAIMFGDELSLDQCERLVARLADTDNPFICAHGRPSLVPLMVFGRTLCDGSRARAEEAGRRAIHWSAWKGNRKSRQTG